MKPSSRVAIYFLLFVAAVCFYAAFTKHSVDVGWVEGAVAFVLGLFWLALAGLVWLIDSRKRPSG